MSENLRPNVSLARLHVTRVAILLLSIVGWQIVGCHPEQPPAIPESGTSDLLIQPVSKTLPVLLTSELIQTSGEPVVACPFKFMNSTGGERLIEFGGAGCSCYGVFVDGRKLSRGDRIKVAPGAEIEFVIQSTVPPNEQLKQLQAQVLEEDNGNWAKIPLECGIRVLSNVRVEPALLSLLLGTEEETAAGQVSVFHCQRGPFMTDTPPIVEGLPDHVTVTAIEPVGTPEEVEPGLWRREWKVNLTCQLDTDAAAEIPDKRVTVSFPGTDQIPRFTQSFQLVARRDLPVRFPREILFGKLAVGEKRSRRVFVSSADRDFELRVASSAVSSEQLQVSVVDPQNARKHFVEVSVTPDAPGRFQGEILLETNLAELPTLRMSVQAYVTGNEPDSDPQSPSGDGES